MNYFQPGGLKWTLCACCAVLSFAPSSFLRAQDDAADAADEAPADVKPALRPSNDPLVRAVLDNKPTTPEELLRAIDTLIDLRAMYEADLLVDQLAKSQIDNERWADLVDEVGSAVFIRLAVNADLQPKGKEIADAALAAADRRARDPARLAKLIEQLGDPSPVRRRGAMLRLAAGREEAIQAIAAALAKPDNRSRLPALRATLLKFGRDAEPVLQALLHSEVAALELQAVVAIGESGQSAWALDVLAPALVPLTDERSELLREAAARALERLIGRLPERDEAVTTLERVARRDFDASLLQPDATAATTTVAWRWDAGAGQLEMANLPPRVALLDRAAHRAADALRLAPDSRTARRIALAARLEAEAHRAGVDVVDIAQSWPTGPGSALALLASEDAAVVDDLLDFALATGHTVAARGAVRALGDLGKQEVLYRREPRAGFLVEAARQGDRRMRLDALGSVLRLKPSKPYPGSSFVVEGLGYFVGTFGAPRVLAADARPLEVQSQAGLLADLGFETDIATTEREVLAETIGSPDYLFALIDFSLARGTSGQLLERLRRDNRTARLPIGIVASSDDLDAAARIARRTSLSMVIIRPVDSAGLDQQLKRLLDLAGQHIVPIEERQQQAEQAMRWLAELSQQTPHIYNLRRIEEPLTRALWTARLSQPAAQVLSTLGTASSQRSLVDLASQLAQPWEARQAAAAAFAASVARFGTLLTTGEVSLQYDRYNQSESQDAETQQLLASLLDTIEARAAAEQAE